MVVVAISNPVSLDKSRVAEFVRRLSLSRIAVASFDQGLLRVLASNAG
ncbi:hypothetical protein GCM10010472_71090 [Pseudonocardia halophobica]|uniref:Uncharacterized protein n=1 Tax=Pseudonocardia halophobica TaxID=29401 RepID=A0A9W6L713_9PSEU|nr:hypothetical protein GCM10017577_33750 [Pseudonocardia halophobica]